MHPRPVPSARVAMIFRRARAARVAADPTSSGSAAPLLSAITAASTPIPPERWSKATKAQGKESAWQAEAWHMLELVGELSFAMLWKTALLSRFRLIASDLDPETGKPTGSTENKAARDVVRQIAGGTTGQSQLLSRLAPLLMIPGEGFLVIIYPGGEEQWHILGRDEVKSQGDQVKLLLSDGTTYLMDPENDSISRIWRQDPRQSWLAWSPTKAALPILQEIVRMSQNIEGAGKSRQAGNGLLIIPQEISLPTTGAPTGTPDPDAPSLPTPAPPTPQFASPGDVRTALQEAMSTAIADPSSAAALVPIIMTAKGEHIGNIKHIRFDSEVSEKAQAAREAAVRRLAMTLDMPPEVLLGLADLNHWSLYGVEEEAVRWHASPEMELICDSFTRELLRPLVNDPTVVVWYDTSDVDAEPDQAEKVGKAYELGVANSAAYARELGLSDTDTYDLETKEGLIAWALDQIRRDATLVPTLGPMLSKLVPSFAALETENVPAPTRPGDVNVPAIESNNRTPDTRDQEAVAASAVVRLCVNEALRLAGKRRQTRADQNRLRGVNPRDTHLPQYLGPVADRDIGRLILGWEDAVDDDTLAMAGLDRTRLRAAVEGAAGSALVLGKLPVVTL